MAVSTKQQQRPNAQSGLFKKNRSERAHCGPGHGGRMIAMYARKPAQPWAVFALTVIVALIAAIPPTVAAQEARFTTITGIGYIDDQFVEDGTIVEAWIRGILVAATETFDSEYELHFAEPSGESFHGDVVRFKLGGHETTGEVGWEYATRTKFNLYAYTGREGEGGDGVVHSIPVDMTAIWELEARLLELEQELSELNARINDETDIEVADVTDWWEGAVAELRAEAEWEIQQWEREFEIMRRQVLPGPRREAILSNLDAELDATIRHIWAEFEIESEVKRGDREDEILGIARAKDLEFRNLEQLIFEIENELKREREKILSGVEIPGGPEPPEFVPAPQPIGPPGEVKDRPTPSPTPEIPRTTEPERNRGFFTNSISVNPNGLNTLDPTALAVIGILITLAATGAQLLKGN